MQPRVCDCIFSLFNLLSDFFSACDKDSITFIEKFHHFFRMIGKESIHTKVLQYFRLLSFINCIKRNGAIHKLNIFFFQEMIYAQ